MIILFRHHFDFRMFGISSLGWGKLTLKYSEDLDPDRRKKINISRKKDGIQIRPKDSEPSDSDAWSTWEHPFLISHQDQHPDLITIHLGTPQSPHKPLGETPISSWSIWGHPILIMIHVGTHLSHHGPLGDTTISWSMHVETPPISSWSTYGHPNLIMIRLCRDTLILWWSCGGHPNLLMILWRTPQSHLDAVEDTPISCGRTPQSHHDPVEDTPISSWSCGGHPNLIMIHLQYVDTPQSQNDPLEDTPITYSMLKHTVAVICTVAEMIVILNDH